MTSLSVPSGGYSTTEATWKGILVHEIGHMVGLEHPFDTDDGDYVAGDATEWPGVTVMGWNNTWDPVDFLPIDVCALQEIWGGAATAGGDALTGDSATNTLSGGAGADLIYGNKGDDSLVGGTGADTLFGGQQSDAVFGLAGADQVYGNKQNDTLHGGLGDDSLFGGQNDDVLYGQVGNDRVDGNRGNDTLYGEEGIDTFVISKGDDWVMDFAAAEDKIETADAYAAITQTVAGGNLVLTDGDGDTLTLLGVTTTLGEGYFV